MRLWWGFVMDKKTEELIALAVSYGVNCTLCMEYHKARGLEAGLTEAEMAEAMKIAEKVKNGAAGQTKKVARELVGGEEGCG